MQGERHSLSDGVIYKLYKEHPCVQSIRAVGFCGQSVIVVQERAVHMPIVAPRARASPAQEGVRTRARTGSGGKKRARQQGRASHAPCRALSVAKRLVNPAPLSAAILRASAAVMLTAAVNVLSIASSKGKKKSLDSSRPLSLRWACLRMGGHWNDGLGTQNQGNHIGDRSCVRQSKLYRRYESGNAVKELLGTGHLRWDENRKQGAYQGQRVYDHNKADHGTVMARNRGGKSGQVARLEAPAPVAPPQQRTNFNAHPQIGEFYQEEFSAPPRPTYPGVQSDFGGYTQASLAMTAGHNGSLAEEHVCNAIEGEKELQGRANGEPTRLQQYQRMEAAVPLRQGQISYTAASVQQPTQHTVAVDLAMPARNERRLDEQRRQRNAAEANDAHVFGNSTAASILKTRPW